MYNSLRILFTLYIIHVKLYINHAVSYYLRCKFHVPNYVFNFFLRMSYVHTDRKRILSCILRWIQELCRCKKTNSMYLILLINVKLGISCILFKYPQNPTIQICDAIKVQLL